MTMETHAPSESPGNTSGASDTPEMRTPKRKTRADGESVTPAKDEIDVFFQSPRKMRRTLSKAGTALDAAINVLSNEQETLSTRLEFAAKLWMLARDSGRTEIASFVDLRLSAVVDVVETLLHTGYFPLQQLCFMAVAAILCRMQRLDRYAIGVLHDACRLRLSQDDAELLSMLPFREVIPWQDPQEARRHVMAINEKTCLCRSFRVLRCWVSPTTKQELVRIRVDKWMDVGPTTATLYWKDNDNVVVVNIPHSVLEKTEVDEENCIMYMWTKHLDNLGGVRLLALTSPRGTFPALIKAITGADAQLDPVNVNVPTTDTPDENGFELEVDSVTPQSNMKATEILQAQTVADKQSDEPALPMTPSAFGASSSHSPSIVNRLTFSPEPSEIESLHDRMSEASADLTSKIATMSAANLELTEDLGMKEYELRAKIDDLQQQRLLHLPQAEFTIERKLAQAQAQCDEDHEDGINYAGESMLHHDEQGLLLSSASVAVLVVIILPWILLIVLHYLGEPSWELLLVWAGLRSIF